VAPDYQGSQFPYMRIPKSWVEILPDGTKRLKSFVKIEILPDLMSDETRKLLNKEVYTMISKKQIEAVFDLYLEHRTGTSGYELDISDIDYEAFRRALEDIFPMLKTLSKK